jgi:hypothetical protein
MKTSTFAFVMCVSLAAGATPLVYALLCVHTGRISDIAGRCNTACYPYQYQIVDDGCYCSTEEGNLELQFEDLE